MKFNYFISCVRVFAFGIMACVGLLGQNLQVLQDDKPKSQQNSVNLEWIASTSPDVFSYNIFRSQVSGGPYSQVNERVRTETTFTDNYVLAGDTYCYVATSVDTSGNQSPYSNESCVEMAQP
jgi:fibronectin type 3 domain-containing protein